MSCVNINSAEYKSLTKGMSPREKFVAKTVMSKFMSNNNGRMPDFIELKSAISDLYNTNKGGIDYSIFYNEVKAIFKSLLPGMSDTELDQRVKFVDKLELMRLRNGKEVLTSFIDNIVYISNTLPEERGEKAYTDIRHEIFHVIFNNFLNDDEQIKMVETFKRWKPEHKSLMNKEELEEKMAEAFEDYRVSPKKTIPVIIRDFFLDILKFLGLISDNYVDIKKLFDDVERGKFTRNFLRDGLVTRDKTILSKYTEFSTNLDLFLQSKAFVLNNLNELMFPEDNKQLSEVGNSNLFLNQQYTSPLFQNNKDLFKLGLTKGDALRQLQRRIRDLANSRSLDPQLTNVINVLSKTHILKDMFEYLQPYSIAKVNASGELVLQDQIEEDPTEELIESDEDYNSLEIGSKDLINPITKISEVVKDFLSSVSYETTPGNFVNIDPGAGFISLLNLMGSLYGNQSVEDNLNTLNRNYAESVRGVQTTAVHRKLVELHENLIAYNRIVLNIQGIPVNELETLRNTLNQFGLQHETFGGNMTVIIPDTLKIENHGTNNVDNRVVFTFNRFREGQQSFRIEQFKGDSRTPAESNKTFIEKIANETGLPNFIIGKLFKYNEQRNQLAELTKVAGSLRKLSPKFVRVQTTRQTVEGFTQTVTSYAFLNKVTDYRSSGSLAAIVRDRFNILETRRDVIETMQSYPRLKERGNRQELRNLLQDILINKLDALSPSDFSKIPSRGNEITNILDTLEKIVNITEMSSDKATEEFTDSDLYLRHTSNFSNLLNKYTFEKNNPTSFSVSTSNKQKWENVMSNTSYKLFKNLKDFGTGLRGVKLLGYFRNSFNNYLRFNPLFDHNFNTGETDINRHLLKVMDEDFYADHQETYFDNRTSTYVKPPTSFGKETPRDWINRNFLAMFQLPIIEAQQAGEGARVGLSYFQQKFQPESAPNVSVIKMGIHGAEGIQQGIAYMILQEAFMNHLAGGSTRGNIVKNTKKSLLPGLEGSTYFIREGVNVFFDGAGNLHPQYGEIVNGKLAINRNNPLIRELVETILNNLDKSIDELVDLAITEKATLEGSSIAEMYNKIRGSYLSRYQLSDSELVTLRGIYITGQVDITEFKSGQNYPQQREVLKKALSAYYLNSFVNGFFMNQLSSGATQNYKNPLDEIKRQAGVNAMNDTGLIDDKHGMKNNYKNVVIAAANNFYGRSHAFAEIPLLQRFFRNKKQEVGDAQSWDIPEYKMFLRKSFGKSVDIGVITKDVHFEINDEGYVDYRKTSSAELTNELVKNNKTLRDLRYALTFQPYLDSLSAEERAEIQPRIDYLYNKLVDNNDLDDVNEYMEYQDILQDISDKDLMVHKASFESAIKGSKPLRMSQFIKNQTTGTFDFVLEPSSILTLNSAYTGIQQAIRHRYIDAFITHFTQLTYLIGLNRTETSIRNNKTITRTLSKLAKSGIFDTLFDLRMTYSNEDRLLKANNRSKKEFIKELVKKLDLPGNERIVELLNTPKISMNNPLFSEKLMQTFFNSFTKSTVKPKHPGGSFVLQSEFGFEANRILSENSMRIPELVRDDQGNLLYAECYLPEMYSDQLKSGEMLYYNSDHYNKMFGFRIPSSDLHSSVPLKVIGFYPSSMHDNVVVIPSAVTALHGSDFDVDKLFVVRYGVFGQDDKDIDPKAPNQQQPEPNVRREYRTKFQGNNVVIAQKGIKFGFTAPEATYNERGSITSFGPNDRHTEIFNIDSILLDEKKKTQDRIIQQEVTITEHDKTPTVGRAQENAKATRRRELVNEQKELEKHLDTLKTIQRGLYSNQILDAVLDNISYSGENAEDILFGITFDPVKGYEEDSEYSQLARVFSDINRAKGSEDLLPERPILYTTLQQAQDADTQLYTKIKENLENNLGIDTDTEKGQEDLLNSINDKLKDDWVDDRDEFIRRQRGSGSININKVEQHVTVHKETYMAAGLVGLIANFSKGLAYAFHGITNDTNHIELSIPDNQMIELDGQRFDKLSLSNRDGIKNQELRSLALNAAIDHVKEQILNVLNVGNKTAKIFLAAISTEMNLHQATMVLLQPVAKELNSSNATTVPSTLSSMRNQIAEKLQEIQRPYSDQELNELRITTRDLERFIQTNFTDLIADTNNPSYRRDLMIQLKVMQQLTTLNQIGQEISDISRVLSIIQELPYNLEFAYEKLKDIDRYIDVEKFFNKLSYQERSEYTQNGFKNDLKSNKNILANVNLANNENVLAALEGIKVQIDITSEMFTENSIQMQYLIQNILKAISNNSEPGTMFTGEHDINISFDTTRDFSIQEKYLKGKETFNMVKMMSRNIFNLLTSGLNISYNKDNHLFSLAINTQELTTITDGDQQFTLTAVRSYINAFLMEEGKAISGNRYSGETFVQSQINPEWRLKPLAIIKRENPNNKFLRGLGVDTNFKDKVRIMTYDVSTANTAENLAEVEQGVNELNTLRNIYVKQDKNGEWINVPSNEHPETDEMNEITFNILKASLYIDKFKFSMSRATNVIPPKYFQKIFLSLETLIKDLIYYQKSTQGNKYYKDFTDFDNQTNSVSALGNIKENLFINTILSVPTVLPNMRTILPNNAQRWRHLNRQAGILPNGNIYDLYFDANVLDQQQEQPDIQAETTIQASELPTEENTNVEVDQETAESEAETNLSARLRRNPSFIVDEHPKKLGTFEIYMKVGATGSKGTNDQKFFYKKIAVVNGKLTNNSFDLNLLLNRYRISDYFNPKRIAIPVKNIDFSGNRVELNNITISNFLVNVQDDRRTQEQERQQVDNAIQAQFEAIRALPENSTKSDQQIRSEIRTKINVQNVINSLNEVSLYDARNLDRIGIKHFRVISRTISQDRRSVSFRLEALPESQQLTYNKFDAPLELLKTVRKGAMTREEKIAYINSIPGAKKITSAVSATMTDAQIDEEFDRATEIEETKEIDQVLKDKSC